jgi:hypothetical protein
MNNIAHLQMLYFQLRLDRSSWKECIAWAIERLQRDEEGDDLDVVTLASATHEDEVLPLVRSIIENHIGLDAMDDELAAGKCIVELHAAYVCNTESIHSLEPKIWAIFNHLEQPTWLVMLARNCEYATNMDFYQKPFEDEFHYISRLWENSHSLSEFLAGYDRNISNSHEANWQPIG